LTILVFNVGSSTVKYGLFPLESTNNRLLDGVVESGNHPHHADGGVGEILGLLEKRQLLASVRAVGHRLVHGGSTLKRPVQIDPTVRSTLDSIVPLAPDHLPKELRVIDEIWRRQPSLPQVACFDTAFHSDLPTVSRLFGLPRDLAESGVVRYGFHGLSYEYITTTLRERGELPARTIVAHLGNGASVAAIRDGKSVDTSMGMTPAGGFVMSTRSGDLDPGALLYLARARGFSIAQIDDVVNRRGGMFGISGSSGDMRKLLAAAQTDASARAAVDVFCYQVKKFIGAYAAALGGLDLLVFTGGIGERSPEVRARICDQLDFLGITLDRGLNDTDSAVISATGSRTVVRALKTDEEAMIARHVRSVVAGRPIL